MLTLPDELDNEMPVNNEPPDQEDMAVMPQSIRRANSGIVWMCIPFVVFGLPIRASGQTTGPEKGTLVIVGGGDRDYVVFRKFIELAGGMNARLVVIPTASSTRPDYDYAGNKAAAYARGQLKMQHVTVVHTHDRSKADEESFVEPIRASDAVWFSGGRQWRIADAYLGTRTERELRAVLERGGVIGGSSAGASIQGSFLVRGDTSGSDVLIGDHQYGFGYIRNSAIDQHLIARHRQRDLIEILTDPDKRMNPAIDRKALLGIGIDEATGIVVRGDMFEVVGEDDAVVLVYDPKKWKSESAASEKYLTLCQGAQYNMRERVIVEVGTPPPP